MKYRSLTLYFLLGMGLLLMSLAGGLHSSQAAKEADPPDLYLPFITKPNTNPDWLKYVNQFRDQVGLPHLTEESTWSDGAVLHSRYMVKNDVITHSEDPSNPWYASEGHEAAQNGNVAVSSSTSTPDEFAIDLWMTGPFHAVGILDPALQRTGFGTYREEIGTWRMGATLDVLRGRDGIPAGVTFPIYFPGDGGETWLVSYTGGEMPDPLATCPGDYATPTGPPIFLQLGSGSVTPNVTDSNFQRDGVSLDHCIFDETNYATSQGRQVLDSRDAVVIMPRDPLAVGETYTTTITHDGTVYTWSFSVVNAPTAVLPIMQPLTYEIR